MKLKFIPSLFGVILLFLFTSCTSSNSNVINIDKLVNAEDPIGAKFEVNGVKYSIGGGKRIVTTKNDNGEYVDIPVEDSLYISVDGLENEEVTDLDIPEAMSLNGGLIPITEFGSSWAFENCNSLKSVKIPGSIIEIDGSETFANCENLESVIICEGVKELSGFQGCINLKNVSLPESLKEINYETFKDCSSLVSIGLPENLEKIGDRAFSCCIALKSIEIPASVNSMGDEIFKGCTSLEKVKLSTNVTILLEEFEDCDALKSIEIPEGVLELKGTFSGCKNLIEVKLPNSLQKIGYATFRDCESLEKIELPKNLTTIGEHAFENCKGLKEITLPEKVSLVKDDAFKGCTGIKSVTALNPYPFPERLAFREMLRGRNYPTPLYVPAQSVEAYKDDNESIAYYFFGQVEPVR